MSDTAAGAKPEKGNVEGFEKGNAGQHPCATCGEMRPDAPGPCPHCGMNEQAPGHGGGSGSSSENVPCPTCGEPRPRGSETCPHCGLK